MNELTNESVINEETKPEFSKEAIIEADGNLPVDSVPPRGSSESFEILDEFAFKKSESTEIEVEKPKTDLSDITTEEIIENSTDKTNIDEINKKAKEYFDEQLKESKIDWDKVDFEDEGKYFPKITKEELDVFSTICDAFIDKESLETYIRFARSDIEEYISMKELVESGKATKDDLKYYETLSKSKENSRMILAIIQQDGRKLDKEFKESRIAEDFIKTVTLKTCAEYIIKKYRLNNSWRPSSDERKNINNTKVISDDLLKKMYIAPLFHYIIERDTIKSEVNHKYNMFGFKFYNDHLDDFASAIRTYIRQGHLDFDKLTIEKVLETDFKTFEFMRIPMVWAMKNFDTGVKVVNEWKMTPEEEEKFASRINPKNIFDNELKSLTESINKGIDVLMSDFVLNQAAYIALGNVINDPFVKKLNIPEDYDWTDCEKVMIDIAEKIPENVTNKNYKEWSEIFKCLQKYERYYLFCRLNNSLSNEELDNDRKRVDTFEVLCGLIDDYYKFMVGELITSIDGFLYESGHNGETQNIMFSTIMSNFICQHELGFRQKLIIDGEDKNTSGEGLYNLAENVLKDKFVYIIGNKKDDILLKNVDLIEVRRTYINDCKEMIDLITHDLIDIRDNFESIKQSCIDIINKPTNTSKKKNKKHRR